ncbi:9480_t:CDS:1, partial [Gigaspora rosea]
GYYSAKYGTKSSKGIAPFLDFEAFNTQFQQKSITLSPRGIHIIVINDLNDLGNHEIGNSRDNFPPVLS